MSGPRHDGNVDLNIPEESVKTGKILRWLMGKFHAQNSFH